MQDYSIIRSPHDKKNPYVMINRNLIKDSSISPECRWLLIFLLSHGDDWEIRSSYVSAHLKGHKGYGRDSIRKLFTEAIEAGYMKAEEYRDGNLNRLRYLLSETPEFKKCCAHTENQGPGDQSPGKQAPGDQGLLINNNSSYFVEEKERNIAQPAARPRQKGDGLSFDLEKGEFIGILEKDLSEWAIIYPHIDLKVEITRSITWLKSNPSKAKKTLWRKFITGWFSRSNDAMENKKAFKSASAGIGTDRRTKDASGNPVENQYKGRF